MLLYVMISRLSICFCLQGHVYITVVEQSERAVKIFTVQKYTQAPTAQCWRAMFMACTLKQIETIPHTRSLHSAAQGFTFLASRIRKD